MTHHSLADYRAAVASSVGRMPALEVLVSDAAGCMLVDDVVTAAPVPAVPLAACDGYAVMASDVAGASVPYPVTLPVSHDVGFDARGSRRHVPGTAARVSTGVALPTGADAVVPTAHTDGGLAKVVVSLPVRAGSEVHEVGADAPQGQVVIPAGTRLDARHIAVASSLGHARLMVRPLPRIVVIAVGSELIEPGSRRHAGGVPEATAHALVVAARAAGSRAYRVGPVRDDRIELRKVIEDQWVRADVLITTGGLSETSHDVVGDVLSEWGDYEVVDLDLYPGRRHGRGQLSSPGHNRTVPVMSLPGSPVAAMVAFEAYVRPALRAMNGIDERDRPTVQAHASRSWNSLAGRTQVIPVSLEGDSASGYHAAPWREDDETTLVSLAAAQGYVLMEPHVTEVAQGERVNVHLWQA